MQAVAWRLLYSVGIGFLLKSQSENQLFTKHFLRNGGSVREAFASWKNIYNYALTMSYVAFVVAAVQLHVGTDNWHDMIGFYITRHLLGGCLIALHYWMSRSVFDALGDFGWHYADFFIDEFPRELHYHGIYRFLNNPEKVLGTASFWGMALMSGSRVMFAVALLCHLANWWFLNYVEAPHMRRLYGSKIRVESGVTRQLKKQLRTTFEPIVHEVKHLVEDLLVEGNSTDTVAAARNDVQQRKVD